jgi:hypothetical protein
MKAEPAQARLFASRVDPGSVSRPFARVTVGMGSYFFVVGLVDPVLSPGSSDVGKQPRQMTSLALTRLCSSASICSRTAHQAAEYGRRSVKAFWAFSLSMFGSGFDRVALASWRLRRTGFAKARSYASQPIAPQTGGGVEAQLESRQPVAIRLNKCLRMR